MFKEIVSLAIILGFILNILYVAHPNTTSYTIAFVISLASISPFVLGWKYWVRRREERERERGRYEAVVGLDDVGVELGSGAVSVDGDETEIGPGKRADLEKGLSGGVVGGTVGT